MSTHWDDPVDWPAAGPARAYDLAVRLEVGMPHHPLNPPFSYTLIKKHGTSVLPNGISAAMEMFTMGTHVGTHVDALGHVSLNGCGYGERDALSSQDWHTGVAVGSVEEMPPLIGPGHLIDAELLFGRRLTPADGIGAEELDRWFGGRPEPGPTLDLEQLAADAAYEFFFVAAPLRIGGGTGSPIRPLAFVPSHEPSA